MSRRTTLSRVMLAAPFALATLAFGADSNRLVSTEAPPAPALKCQVKVDPRVELISLLFRLAGNPEYSNARVAAYSADVERQFDAHRDHPAVQLARRLRETRGVSYDACMSLAVHVSDAFELQPLVPLQPWPEGLDQRWTPEHVSNFLAAARQFVKDTSFRVFLNQQQDLYGTTCERMQTLLEQEAHLEWFGEFFGERPQATFTVTPALLNGGSCYGPHYRDAAGREELFCILGVWKTDREGLPLFTRDMLETVVHEFCHSYVNAIVDRHRGELAAAGRKLFQPVAARMRAQAYGEPEILLRESLVRACTVRYVRQFNGAQAAQREIQEQKQRSFLWMAELSDLLAEYETQRERYPTLESFAPRLVTFFNEYAEKFAEEQTKLEATRPKVISLTPDNGATGVDPSLAEIRVVFDRPMRDGAWSMVGSGPHFPELVGKPRYDVGLTNWAVAVKLKPDWNYEFRLNSETYDAFRSATGVPLEPVTVRFTTAKE